MVCRMKCEIFNIQESQCSSMGVGVGGLRSMWEGLVTTLITHQCLADERTLGNTHLGEDGLTLLPVPA